MGMNLVAAPLPPPEDGRRCKWFLKVKKANIQISREEYVQIQIGVTGINGICRFKVYFDTNKEA